MTQNKSTATPQGTAAEARGVKSELMKWTLTPWLELWYNFDSTAQWPLDNICQKTNDHLYTQTALEY